MIPRATEALPTPESEYPGAYDNGSMINRMQALVLSFFAFAWVGLVIILVVAPEIYDQTLKLSSDQRRVGEGVFVLAISALIALLSVGVVRRWSWAFWLILIAFLAGAIRVLASMLEIIGIVPTPGPTWYAVFQGVLGAVQFAVGLTMLAGYRRAGVWGNP